eukprot:CAMPEP_0180139284 /NCGR_PEP_ID=MMETSP0986-20121125/13437_1 /TAXON_ID=697907 /ORGANISM="non described non described, Strain CCMP2293" /LENGTH=43 /DNA_ID= /DNA_START= /DNA_END= /DNA_ORIENTATION=
MAARWAARRRLLSSFSFRSSTLSRWNGRDAAVIARDAILDDAV